MWVLYYRAKTPHNPTEWYFWGGGASECCWGGGEKKWVLDKAFLLAHGGSN